MTEAELRQAMLSHADDALRSLDTIGERMAHIAEVDAYLVGRLNTARALVLKVKEAIVRPMPEK